MSAERKYANGGYVPGPPALSKIPARQCYVLTAAQVKAYGVEALEAFRQGLDDNKLDGES